MNKTHRAALERAGWKVGSAAEFLGLSRLESELIELKLGLASELKRQRRKQRLTQTALAARLHTSQSRLANMEAADPTVSVDLLVRALLHLGMTRKALARVIASSGGRHAA